MSNSNQPSPTNLADLLFVGFNSRAAALHRDTGDIVWEWKTRQGTGFVALLLDGDRLMASVSGYTYCLDARTGNERWMNPMAGFGTGVPCLTSVRGTSLGASLLGHEEDDDDDQPTGAGVTYG